MIVEMRRGASQVEVDQVVGKAEAYGFNVQLNMGTDKTIIAILGSNTGQVATENFAVLEGVETVTRIMRPFKLASREFKEEDSKVSAGGVEIGGERIVVMAGPCAVESKDQLMEAAWAAKEAGASMLRGGCFKPRTSPFSFQGLGESGLQILGEVGEKVGLPVVTEVMDAQQVGIVAEYAAVLQIGARNMQNFTLLNEVGKATKPVMLKRGLSSTVTEWLTAADYILSQGNDQVFLCERGIRTFEDSTRFTFDVSALPVIRRFSHLPVVADPSHAAGHFSLVPDIAKAAVAAGADGLIIEIHPDPRVALCDGLQSLTPSNFTRLMEELKTIAKAVGRYI